MMMMMMCHDVLLDGSRQYQDIFKGNTYKKRKGKSRKEVDDVEDLRLEAPLHQLQKVTQPGTNERGTTHDARRITVHYVE
jgi:hypothetical protein